MIPGQIKRPTLQAALLNNTDVSGLFDSGHTVDNTVRRLKSARHCHIGTIGQEPAGAQQGQSAQHAQTGQPGRQGQNGGHGQNVHQGQNGRNGQGQIEQPDAANDDEGGTAAERRRREEARNRRLRKTYNPLKQDPDDADEYPADAVAMGYLPDLQGRRWREKRMRLSRYIQYIDGPAVDEEDIDPAAAAWLDLDFAKEIRYKKNLKGGSARGCTGSFRVARPPPPRSQLRLRGLLDNSPQGPEQDPSDSDASSSSDDDDASGAPALRTRHVQVEGRVRQWFPSRSNRTRLNHGPLATPPATPRNHLAQPTVQPPIQPPTPPPQHPQQMTPEQEQASAKQRRAKEAATAREVIRKQQRNPAAVKEQMDKLWPVKDKTKATPTKPRPKKETPQSSQSQEKTEKVEPKGGEKQPAPKQSAPKQDGKKQQQAREREERRKQQEAENAQRVQREQQRLQRENDEKQRPVQEATQERLAQMEPKKVQDANKRADEERRRQEEAQRVENARNRAVRVTGKKAEKSGQTIQEMEAQEEQESRDSQAANRAAYQDAKAQYAAQQAAIREQMQVGGYSLETATAIVQHQDNGLLEDPDKITPEKKDPDKKAPRPKGTKGKFPELPKFAPISFATPTTPTTTPPKRPAETTQADRGSPKRSKVGENTETPKVRKKVTPKAQAGSSTGGGGASGKYSDANRPKWSTPKKQQQQQQTGGVLDRSDDEDYSSQDELAPAVQTGGGTSASARGPANTPRQDVPDLPAGLPPVPTRTGPSGTPPYVPIRHFSPSMIPPAGGIPRSTPTTTTTTKTKATVTTGRPSIANRLKGPSHSTRAIGPGRGTPIPTDIQRLRDSNSSGPSGTTKRRPGR